MIPSWLEKQNRTPQLYAFNVIDISEKRGFDDLIKNYLGEQTLLQYESLDKLKRHYAQKKPKDLIKYLRNYAFPNINHAPPNGKTIVKNVKQGDFGEILTTLIIENFTDLKVPISKLRYKFNKDRSMFCTDLISHNQGSIITDLKYYEIKTRTSRQVLDVGTEAYLSLLKDEQKPSEAIANFLSNHYFCLAETLKNAGGENDKVNKLYELSDQFNDIVDNPQSYNRSFEIVLIIEKKFFNEEILDRLNKISLQLSPLEVTIILIDNLKCIVNDTFRIAKKSAVANVYNSSQTSLPKANIVTP